MAKTRYALAGLVTTAALILAGCSSDEGTSASSSSKSSAATSSAAPAATTVTVTDNYGEKTIDVPVERVVALDNRTFETLADWGVKLEAAPVDLIPDTISYAKDSSIVNIGNHKEPNLEAIIAADPQLIISGQRFTKYDEQIEKDNPNATLVDFEVRKGEPLDQELIRQTEALGQIFGKEAEAKKLVDDFNKALERAKKAYDGTSTVMAVNIAGGNINYIAPGKGRTYGALFELLGLKPALEHVEGESSDHKGDDISVEAIAQSNPDFLFALDRDGGANPDDPAYVSADKVLADAAPLQNVTAIKSGHVYIAPKDTYVNESIQTYTEILNGIADTFEAAQK